MPERTVPGPISNDQALKEAVCVHTQKIYDACRDKDCLEDLRVYPTRRSQEIIDRAINVKSRRAELLWVYIDVEAVPFNRGFYSIDVKYFYRIVCDAFCGVSKPVEVTGLATFDKRVILFGSEGNAKIFSSKTSLNAADDQVMRSANLPIAVVETKGYVWEGFTPSHSKTFRPPPDRESYRRSLPLRCGSVPQLS